MITFKGPKEVGCVYKLMNVDQQDWYRPHFKKLLELYTLKLSELNNTEADRFIKNLKTSFLYEGGEEPKEKNAKPKFHLNSKNSFKVKIISNSSRSTPREYQTMQSDKLKLCRSENDLKKPK